VRFSAGARLVLVGVSIIPTDEYDKQTGSWTAFCHTNVQQAVGRWCEIMPSFVCFQHTVTCLNAQHDHQQNSQNSIPVLKTEIRWIRGKLSNFKSITRNGFQGQGLKDQGQGLRLQDKVHIKTESQGQGQRKVENSLDGHPRTITQALGLTTLLCY
jgi:hypothetical protein